MISITLFKADEKCFINCDREGTIYADETPTETIETIEDTYNKMHDRSYESSMSACIYHIFFHPRVVVVKDIEEIKNHIAAEERHIHSLQNVSGHAYGITCRPEANEYWEKAAEPRLISERPKEPDFSI
jgi:hypothetical protein